VRCNDGARPEDKLLEEVCQVHADLSGGQLLPSASDP